MTQAILCLIDSVAFIRFIGLSTRSGHILTSTSIGKNAAKAPGAIRAFAGSAIDRTGDSAVPEPLPETMSADRIGDASLGRITADSGDRRLAASASYVAGPLEAGLKGYRYQPHDRSSAGSLDNGMAMRSPSLQQGLRPPHNRTAPAEAIRIASHQGAAPLWRRRHGFASSGWSPIALLAAEGPESLPNNLFVCRYSVRSQPACDRRPGPGLSGALCLRPFLSLEPGSHRARCKINCIFWTESSNGFAPGQSASVSKHCS